MAQQRVPVLAGERDHARLARSTARESTAAREAVVATLQSLVEPLATALGPGNEVVVHDLALLPNSIVAISGGVTGRSIGGPATDLLLQETRQGRGEDLLRYRSSTRAGVPLLSSTIFVRDARGVPIASLCINTDQSAWLQMQPLVLPVSGTPARAPAPTLGSEHAAGSAQETFPASVESLTASMVDQAILSIGVRVELMQRAHKLEVVRKLEAAGVFLIRDAVDYVAGALQVTRYTIYNYLGEIREQSSGVRANGRRATMKRLPLGPGPASETDAAAPGSAACRRPSKARGVA